MKMKKWIISLVACSCLTAQGQQVGEVYHPESRAKQLLREAKLLYNERSYDMAEVLVRQAMDETLTHDAKHEASALMALIA